MTEHCSGTRIPALFRARRAPKALMSSKARRALNGRFWRMSSSVNLTRFETGKRIARLRQIHDQARIEFQLELLGEVSNSPPPWRAVGEPFGPANERDLAMPKRVQMLERQVSPHFIVHDY